LKADEGFMTEHKCFVFRFADFEVREREFSLIRAGEPLQLEPKAFRVLQYLLHHPQELVTKDELLDAVWKDIAVTENSPARAVAQLRRVLGDDVREPRFIATVTTAGYRFVCPVRASEDGFFGLKGSDIAPVDNGVAHPEPVVKVIPPPKPWAWNKPLAYALTLGGLALLAICTTAIWKAASSPPRAPRVLRFTKLTNDGQVKYGPLATDGSRIYFTVALPDGRRFIAQVSVTGGEIVPILVPLKQPQVLDLSKEGTELLVADSEGHERSSLWLQPVAGGSPRRLGTALAEGVHYGNYRASANFGADGTSVIYSNHHDLDSMSHDVYSMSLDGSSARKLLTTKGIPISFRFSPGARDFRLAQLDVQSATATTFEAAADGKGLHPIFGGCCGEWTTDGRFFIFQNRIAGRFDLWALRTESSFHWQKREHKPTRLTTGPLDFRYPLPSRDGKEIFAIGISRQAEVICYDSRSGHFVPYLSGISAEGLAFSPDRQWVAYTSYPDGTLWRSKADGSERLQLTFPPMWASGPRWSPDGKQIAFEATVPGTPWNIYMISSGGGTAQRILPSDWGQLAVDWSPDGNSLVFGSAWDSNLPISIIDLKSRRVSPLPGSRGLYFPAWSPNGRYIAGLTASDSQKLMLFDFSTQRWTEAYGGSVEYPTWSNDGEYLYFEYFPALNPFSYRIVRLRPSDGKIENVAELSNIGRLTTGTFGQWFGLAPDDSPLLARDISTQEIYALEMEWP
jgi:DNA-binding winged helix-turn-helix (wHTH) protein/Tol biopolymer transport system component